MVYKCLVNIILKRTIFLCNWLKEKLVKDQTVDFKTFVETSYTYDFNFVVLDSQNLFLVNEVTV